MSLHTQHIRYLLLEAYIHYCHLEKQINFTQLL